MAVNTIKWGNSNIARTVWRFWLTACKYVFLFKEFAELKGLLLSDAHWTEQMQIKSCVRADLSLVAFFEKKLLGGSEKSLNLATKSLSWQHCVHLYYSPLSLSDCSSTRIFTLTHTYRNIWTTANRGGGPPFTISDWFRSQYEPNVCLLLNHRETFRVAETFFLSNG